MRIAFIGQKGIAIGDKAGGIEQHVLALSRELAARGHEVTVYARHRYRASRAEVPRGVRVRYIQTIYLKHLETILYSFFATLDALFRRFDIIHYHGVGPATLAWIPRLWKPHARVVATFHSQDRYHQKWGFLARRYLHFGEWAACHFPHATIAVSHVIQVYVRRSYRRQIVYIPNGARIEQSSGQETLELYGLQAGKYLLNVSRLVPHKGQHYLIEAFQRLKNTGRGAGMKLAIVRAAVYTQKYEQELKDQAAGSADIVFLGFQQGEALRQLYAHAFLYAQPSESEGLSVSVLEAMSFGIPPIVSDIPENLEVIHRAGFTFRNKDVEHLSQVLGELMAHPDIVEAKRERVREVVETKFAWPVIAEHTEGVYRSVRH